MSDQIVRADKRYRKRALLFYILSVLLSLVLVAWVLPRGTEYLRNLDPDAALLIADTVLVLMLLSVAPMGLYLLRLAGKILKEERFPPQGTKVLRDTLLVTGRKATVRGYVLRVVSVILIVVGLFGALNVDYLVRIVVTKGG
jgi:L-asparagine transporter-like permease